MPNLLESVWPSRLEMPRSLLELAAAGRVYTCHPQCLDLNIQSPPFFLHFGSPAFTCCTLSWQRRLAASEPSLRIGLMIGETSCGLSQGLLLLYVQQSCAPVASLSIVSRPCYLQHVDIILITSMLTPAMVLACISAVTPFLFMRDNVWLRW